MQKVIFSLNLHPSSNVCAYDGELDISSIIRRSDGVSKAVDIVNPLGVAVEFVRREPDDFYAALLKVLLLACDFAEFGRADLSSLERLSVIGRVRTRRRVR